ncbi:hypothetical protein IFM89_029238 [Coptis chinensis]|uniref:Uncharacterized protein n=1 Tax=Coptis chinensis TaxID=261450 RepID=A0A835IUU7_9MAGN|nr:hypothetical protein IFM89_029238 [Coptis chinensis]
MEDSSGAHKVSIADDHDDQLCESVLISSLQKDCALAMPGRERARVIFTNNNGINSNNRFANNLGFIKDEPLAACAQVLKLYEGDEV